MIKLDKTDLKILHQLDLNARQPNSKIAKFVKISKDSVGYRIKKLENEKIIRGYGTIIDSSKLGYTPYRVLLNLIDINENKLNDIIHFLKNEKEIWWIAKLDGIWNFAFAIWGKNNLEVQKVLNQFQNKYRSNIENQSICPIISYEQLNRAYLLKVRNHKTRKYTSSNKEKYDKIDLEILKELTKNARTSIIEIAKKLNLDSMTIIHRIKNLEKKKIIQGYRVDLDFSLLNRDFYAVKITLKNYSQKKEIKDYLKNQLITTNFTEAIGSYDIELDIEVKNTKEYYKFTEDLKNKFNTIRKIQYFRVIKNYKTLSLPKV